MTSLSYIPLGFTHCSLLAPHLRSGDRVECAVSEMTPLQSLRYGQASGPSWAVVEGEVPTDGRSYPHVLGAGGYTHAGALWSYWRDLSARQSRALMKLTPEWMRGIRDHAGDRQLGNLVWDCNGPALAWLRQSHCFHIDLDKRIVLGKYDFIPFTLKSAEELANV